MLSTYRKGSLTVKLTDHHLFFIMVNCENNNLAKFLNIWYTSQLYSSYFQPSDKSSNEYLDQTVNNHAINTLSSFYIHRAYW